MTSPPADDEYDLAPLPRHATALFVRALWATAKVALLKLKGSVTEVARLTKHISGLDKRIAELEHRLALDSHNSHKPPSTNPLYRKPSPAPAPSLEDGAPKRSVGGQPGHAGATLRQVTPDEVIICALPPTCPCGLALNPVLVGRRQVFDTPQPRLVVTEFHVYEAQCACGKHHQSELPAGVNAPAQYGPVLTAQAVLLTQHHAVPFKRCAEILGAFTGQNIQSGTIKNRVRDAALQLTPVVRAIRNAVVGSPVVHADETGMRGGNGLTWLHAAVTEWLTWIAPHKNRGLTGMRELDLLPHVRGTLVYDGLASYGEFETLHALCNAHHLRELANIAENTRQQWATDMIAFLLRANALAKAASAKQLPELQRTELRAVRRHRCSGHDTKPAR